MQTPITHAMFAIENSTQMLNLPDINQFMVWIEIIDAMRVIRCLNRSTSSKTTNDKFTQIFESIAMNAVEIF